MKHASLDYTKRLRIYRQLRRELLADKQTPIDIRFGWDKDTVHKTREDAVKHLDKLIQDTESKQ